MKIDPEKLKRIKMKNGQLCAVCGIEIISEHEVEMYCSRECATGQIPEEWIEVRVAQKVEVNYELEGGKLR